jgi:hypothetical protein
MEFVIRYGVLKGIWGLFAASRMEFGIIGGLRTDFKDPFHLSYCCMGEIAKI